MVEKANKKLFKDEEPNIKIGATIKLKRKEQNKTLSDVSEKAGVSLSFISKIENDHIKANLNHIKGILEDLNIHESVFSTSENMNQWYENLLDFYLDLGDPNISFREIIDNRDDFQSRMIELAVDIKKGYYGNSEKNISLLLSAMDTMKPIEVSIFLLIVTEYHMYNHELIKASELLSILKKKAFIHEKIELWMLELIFKLALCSNNEQYISRIFKNLQEKYIMYNLYGKSAEKRMEYIKQCAYIKDDDFFKGMLCFDKHIEHRKAYLLNLFLQNKVYKAKQELDTYEDSSEFSLIQTLIYHDMNLKTKAELAAQSLIIHPYDSPIEVFLKNYMISIYVTNESELFLKTTLGQKSNFFYNTTIIELAMNYYLKYLMSNQRYKESTQFLRMIYSRLHDIQKAFVIF